jgi:hypothetical protein
VSGSNLYPIVAVRKRRVGLRYLWVSLASLAALGLLPMLNIAQASRQTTLQDMTLVAREDLPTRAPTYHADIPGSVTLGELIEVQRRIRLRRLAAAAPRVAIPPLADGWQAQLGAFSSPEAAERQRARLIQIGAPGLPIVIRQAGTIHRLQSVPALRIEAEALCSRAQASGIDCFTRRAAATT